MKKFIPIIVACVLVLALAVPAMADSNSQKGKSENAANDQPGAGLYLYEKDADWLVVEGGAWGKLQFTGDAFVFNGHGLEAGVCYCLVNGEWNSVDCLGSGTANGGGNVNISGDSADFCGKVWLVLCDDLNDNQDAFTAWNPADYLFEHNELPCPDTE